MKCFKLVSSILLAANALLVNCQGNYLIIYFFIIIDLK